MEFVCLDFLNSDWHDYRGTGRSEDRLLRPAWMEKFLQRWGLQVAQELDAAELTALIALRTLLQRMVEQLVQGQQLSDEDIAALNAAMETMPLIHALTRTDATFHLALTPLARDWRWIRATIAASFAELLAHHDISRIKICANTDCRWIFYDESKSHSRRWCDDATCGNLMKVRRFRARQRHPGNTTRTTSTPTSTTEE